MKKNYLKKQIIIGFCASAVLAAMSGASIYYRLHQEQAGLKTINQIKAEILDIQDEQEALKNKIIEIKKYRKVYKTISEKNKNTKGIKIDDINLKVKELGDKYNIYNPNIKVSFPENMTKGIFRMSTIAMVSSSVTLSFVGINDIESLLFIAELTDSLPGYVIINNMSIKKTREYSESDLIGISSGRGNGNIAGQVSFHWYVYKITQKEDLEDTKEDKDGNEQE